MIELNDLIAGKLRENSIGFNVWGFLKSPKGDIKLDSITWPMTLGDMKFQIYSYYMDSFMYDIEHEGIIVPMYSSEEYDEIQRNDQYYSHYYPVHEYYIIPRIHCKDTILDPYDELNGKLRQFEKLINNFYVTREEIDSVVEYIEKFFYKKEK